MTTRCVSHFTVQTIDNGHSCVVATTAPRVFGRRSWCIDLGVPNIETLRLLSTSCVPWLQDQTGLAAT